MHTRFPELNYRLSRGDLHPELPRAGAYHRMSYGAGSLTYEEAAFLWGLVLVLRPQEVLETGTETGASLYHLALALRDAGGGRVTSIDRSMDAVRAANAELRARGLHGHGRAVQGGALAYIRASRERYDLMFLDTLIPLRIEELRTALALEKLKPGGIAVLHDSAPGHPMGEMNAREELRRLPGVIHLPSPRGMTLVQAALD